MAPGIIEREMGRLLAHIQENPFRGAWRATAIVTVSATVVSGLLMRLTDPDDFASIWDGLWWASAAPPLSRPPPSRPVRILTAGARPARRRRGFTRVTPRPVEGPPAGRIYRRATSFGAARARGAASEVST